MNESQLIGGLVGMAISYALLFIGIAVAYFSYLKHRKGEKK